MRFMKFASLNVGHKTGNCYSTSARYVNKAVGGGKNFEKEFNERHIETSAFQKFLLGLGSGLVSITDPRRGDMVAVLGESTGSLAFDYIRSKMLQSDEGKRILSDKPRISSSSVDLEQLKDMPEGTLGKTYSNFLERYNYSPDSRLAVRFVDDLELAYVAQRYREVHDLFHTVLEMPTNMLGEVTVKWVEAIQTRIPMCVTGALFGPLRLAPKLFRTFSTKVEVTLEPKVFEGITNMEISPKHHPGKFSVPRVELPAEIEKTIITVLKQHHVNREDDDLRNFSKKINNKSVPVEGKRMQEKVMKFTRLTKERLKIKCGNLSDEDLERLASKKVEQLLKNLKTRSEPIVMNKLDCFRYLACRAPYEYSAIMRIFIEVSKKDPAFKPHTLFDFGSGVGTVVWAASVTWKNSLKECFTVDCNKEMNDLALKIIRPAADTPLVKNLYQRQFLPSSEEDQYDIVVSAFTLLNLKNQEQRFDTVRLLWNKTYKYLILVEDGTKAGFFTINEAKDLLLHVSEVQKFRCHVFSPCPHDLPCPKALRRSKCNFPSSYKGFSFESEPHETRNYSYVVFRKGTRPSSDTQWPRIVNEVLLRKRHSICDMCTKEGRLERVIYTPKKSGKDLYKFSRYLKWGDCFPGKVCSVEPSNVTLESEVKQDID